MSSVAGTGHDLRALVRRALEEDGYQDDASSAAVVPDAARATGTIVAKEAGVLAGCEYADCAFRSCDPSALLEWQLDDGDRFGEGDIILRCEGRARDLLRAERVALNFLQQLSGVATTTARYARLAGRVTILDTRKTIPCLRDAQKSAVRAGGGRNHRRDLADQLLLKENHFAASGAGFAETVRRAVAGSRGRVVGVEVRALEEARQAIQAGADYVLLDNFPASDLRRLVTTLRAEFPQAVLEASGGIREETVAAIAATGVDRISVGALTHSHPAVDFSFSLALLNGEETRQA